MYMPPICLDVDHSSRETSPQHPDKNGTQQIPVSLISFKLPQNVQCFVPMWGVDMSLPYLGNLKPLNIPAIQKGPRMLAGIYYDQNLFSFVLCSYTHILYIHIYIVCSL